MIINNVDVLYLEDGNEYRPVLKTKPQLCFFSQTFNYVVIHDKTNALQPIFNVYFDMTLTFDLEDNICILFLVFDYVVVHVKHISLQPIYCEI